MQLIFREEVRRTVCQAQSSQSSHTRKGTVSFHLIPETYTIRLNRYDHKSSDHVGVPQSAQPRLRPALLWNLQLSLNCATLQGQQWPLPQTARIFLPQHCLRTAALLFPNYHHRADLVDCRQLYYNCR